MIFIDSDCIIDFLRGKEGAKNIVGKYENEIVTSQINVFEVFFGFFNKGVVNEREMALANSFFNSVEVFSFDKMCGVTSAKILSDLMKKGSQIDQNDCFIAAIMARKGVNSIITNNKKHFSKVKGIKVMGY